MIGVIDYGLGNVHAFLSLYEDEGVPARTVTSMSDLDACEALILPGVGAFDSAMDRLESSGLRESLDYAVLKRSTPVLGVCVGFQMMCNSSEEGVKPGLGWLDATVRRFDPAAVAGMLPHMGWNDVQAGSASLLLSGITSPSFYFLHSYHVDVADSTVIAARSHYGVDFVAAVEQRNLFATQFHPEKSHEWGRRVLLNFAQIAHA